MVNAKGGGNKTDTTEHDRAIKRATEIQKKIKEKTEYETACELIADIFNTRFLQNQKELDTILSNDYIKKLVFYICSNMDLYKGTQELLLNGNI